MSELLNVGELILNRYEVIGVLGQGGMGVVYRCLDRVSDMLVAVKGLVPSLSGDEKQMAEVKRNFQLVAELRHAGIAGLRNLEQDPTTGAYYLVMDYVRGNDLTKYIREHQLSLADTFAILVGVADALDYAHRKGVLHRDVKPDNVKIAEDGLVKLLDFGIAANMQSRSSAGTPWYMAPEQWYGEKQGPETDEYALAAMAYEIVYGKVPHHATFSTTDDYNVMAAATLQEPLAFPDKTPEKVRKVFTRALAPKREVRYPTCRKFIRALALAMGYAKVARPKYARLAWGLVSVLLGATLAFGGHWWYEHGKRLQAEDEREANHRMYLSASNAYERALADWTNAKDRSAEEQRMLKERLDTAEKNFKVVEGQRRAAAEEAEKARIENANRKEIEGRLLEAQSTNEGLRVTLERKLSEISELKGRVDELSRRPMAPPEFDEAGLPTPAPITDSVRKVLSQGSRGAGFFYKAFPNGDYLNAFRVCRAADKRITMDAALLDRRFDYPLKLAPSMIVYATYMHMKGGSDYTFFAAFDDDALVVVEDKLVLAQEYPARQAEGVYSPAADGWYRLVLVGRNRGGIGGAIHGMGFRYRSGNGRWMPFECSLGIPLFRQRVAGRNPAEDEAAGEKLFSAHIDEWIRAKKDVQPVAEPEVPALTHRWSFTGGSVKDAITKASAVVSGAVERVGNAIRIKGCDDNKADFVDFGHKVVPDDGSAFSVEIWASPHRTFTLTPIFCINYGNGRFDEPSEVVWSWGEGGLSTSDYQRFFNGPEDMTWNDCGYVKFRQHLFEKDKSYHLLLTGTRLSNGMMRIETYVALADDKSCSLIGKRDSTDIPAPCWQRSRHFYLAHSELGGHHNGDATYDEVRVWNAALTEDDFKLSHRKGASANVAELIKTFESERKRQAEALRRGAISVRPGEKLPSNANIKGSFTIHARFTPTGGIEDFPSNQKGSGCDAVRDCCGPMLWGLGHGQKTGTAALGILVGTNGVIVLEHATSHMPTPLIYRQALPKGTVDLVLICRESAGPLLYINGRRVAEGVPTDHVTRMFPDATLGGKNHYRNYPFRGSIASFEVYGRALSDVEAKTLFGRSTK